MSERLEHRCGIRYPADAMVYVRWTNGSLTAPGMLTNISINGCFIFTMLPAEPGLLVNVRLLGAEWQLTQFDFEGRVRRCARLGVGIEWTHVVPELVRSLMPDVTIRNDGYASVR